MGGVGLRGGARGWVEFVGGALIDVEARDMCGDLVGLTLEGCHLKVQEVAALSEVVGRGVPG